MATYQEQLAALDKQIAAEKNVSAKWQKEVARLKKIQGQGSRGQIASRAASLKAAETAYNRSQTQLAGLKTQHTGVQQQLWKSAGQYENLLKGTDRDAYIALQTMFKSFGLESLAAKIYDYGKQGYSADTISILLQDTDEYKKRFAGNEARKKAGHPVLSAAEYLDVESKMKQGMLAAGLPSGFYDQPADFATFIGRNTSPHEIESRIDMAKQAAVLANPDYKRALNQMGIDDNHLAAYFLDPTKALPHLQKAAATAAIGSEALRQNIGFDQTYAEKLALQGVSAEQARQGYAQIAATQQGMEALGKMSGVQYGMREAEQAEIEGLGTAVQKKAKLLSQERGRFSGGTGGAQAGLGQRGGRRS